MKMRIAAHFTQSLTTLANACWAGVTGRLKHADKGLVAALSAALQYAFSPVHTGSAIWWANARKSLIRRASGIFETLDLACAIAIAFAIYWIV
ncbi:hypothetical protein [Paraburkholderia sp. J67]|uniref:hypothetical protein n=1 Tax=Paraburkholderia sp. J67 TaxID=2805435 RepID=UPI002ABDD1FA|nr:hypothetical protein [Paraburkholderia sp. J67]